MKLARKFRLFVARISATYLWLISDSHYRIQHIWIMYSGFCTEEEQCRQRMAADAAVSRLLGCSDVPRYGLRYIVFLQEFLEQKHRMTIARKGLFMLFVRYEKGSTDDEDILTALLIDYSIRLTRYYMDGDDTDRSRKMGHDRAIEYLIHIDPSTEKSKRYNCLEKRFVDE